MCFASMFHWVVTPSAPEQSEVEHIIRASEILAVARALEAGNTPRVGQAVDYFIEPEACGLAGFGRPQGKPYRVHVEQWHLDGAARMVETWKRNPAQRPRPARNS